MWELKPEFRHYKKDAEDKKEKDGGDDTTSDEDDNFWHKIKPGFMLSNIVGRFKHCFFIIFQPFLKKLETEKLQMLPKTRQSGINWIFI